MFWRCGPKKTKDKYVCVYVYIYIYIYIYFRMAVLLKVIFRLTAILAKIPIAFFIEVDKLILKFT